MEELLERASHRYGVFTNAQAAHYGLSVHVLSRRVRAGRLVRLHAGVFAVAGAPASWEQSIMAACLAAGPGAVASHRSAARIWRLVEPSDEIVEISVPRSQRPRLRRVMVHRSTDLVPGHTSVRQRIPVTNPMRTIVDLGAVLRADKVEDALDTAWRRRRCSRSPASSGCATRWAGKGAAGPEFSGASLTTGRWAAR